MSDNSIYFYKKVCKKNKGQLSIEFIIIFSAIMFLFLFFAMLFFTKYSQIQYVFDSFSTKRTCDKISGTIDNIYVSSEGVYANIFIPTVLSNGINYSIVYTQNYTKNILVIMSANGETSCPIVARNVTGIISPGKYNTIKKIKSGVVIV
ncbi:MAG: hypothetical protein WC755_02615 [Candidatus Woesearchaeota archaeon]|jgi:hypothetical protein